MILPEELRNNIEEEASKFSIKDLKEISEQVSLNYRDKSRAGKRIVTNEKEAIVYGLTRMPATYASIYQAIKYSIVDKNIDINNVLDVGSGTGAGEWVISELLHLNNIVCIEREVEMKNLAIRLMQTDNDLKSIKFISEDITNNNVIEDKYDLVLSSYCLNEIIEKQIVIDKLWNCTNKVLLLIEPGTPEGYKTLISVRDYLIFKGGNVIAPCMNNDKCKIDKDDWCSFSVRVERSKLHKMLKQGESPFEDEKFFYMAIGKEQIINNNKEEKSNENEFRILRHPNIGNSRITFKVCNGEISEITLTKKHSEYKSAKKLNNGDIIKISDNF